MKIYISQSNSEELMKKCLELGASECWINSNRDDIYISKIIVPKEKRGTGIGTSIMQYLTDYADEHHKVLTLSPSADYGATSKARLVSFYRRFGFKPNRGKYADYRFSSSMIRRPMALSSNSLIGYKIMGYVDGKIVSHADHRITFPSKIGALVTLPGNGIYLCKSKEFVLKYYTGMSDDDDVLLTLEFNLRDLLIGSLRDKESELAVRKARIKAIEVIPNEN